MTTRHGTLTGEKVTMNSDDEANLRSTILAAIDQLTVLGIQFYRLKARIDPADESLSQFVAGVDRSLTRLGETLVVHRGLLRHSSHTTESEK
jgi:hypothetical protein